MDNMTTKQGISNRAKSIVRLTFEGTSDQSIVVRAIRATDTTRTAIQSRDGGIDTGAPIGVMGLFLTPF